MTPDLFEHPGWHHLDALPAPTVSELRTVPVTAITPRGLRTRYVLRDVFWKREIFAVSTLATPAVYRVRYRLQEGIHADA